MKDLPAIEFMEQDPTTAHPEMSLSEVVALFWGQRVRALPVTDPEGRLVGVVSERDLFLKKKGLPFSLEKITTLLGQPVSKDQLTELELAGRVTVGEVMSCRPVTVGPETTLEEASMHMLDRRLSVLPVVDGDRLIGMIRRINLLQGIYTNNEQE